IHKHFVSLWSWKEYGNPSFFFLGGGIYIQLYSDSINKLISGVLNNRNFRNGIALLLPRPALTYCFVPAYSHNPVTRSFGGKKLFGSYHGSGIKRAPMNGKRICPPW